MGLNALNFKIVDKVSVDWPSRAEMLYFKDKLYVRHPDLGREKPFIVYDANTLKHLEDFEIKIEDPSKESSGDAEAEESDESDKDDNSASNIRPEDRELVSNLVVISGKDPEFCNKALQAA